MVLDIASPVWVICSQRLIADSNRDTDHVAYAWSLNRACLYLGPDDKKMYVYFWEV